MSTTRTPDTTPTPPNHRAGRAGRAGHGVDGIWGRCLLTVLGGCQLLMATGTGPLLMAAGGLSGAVLIAAAWVPITRRAILLSLILVGTVPFAVLAWTAVVPVLVMLAALAVTVLGVLGVLDRGPHQRRQVRPDPLAVVFGVVPVVPVVPLVPVVPGAGRS